MYTNNVQAQLEILNQIPESFAFLSVGHWLSGQLGEDRKNLSGLIHCFFDTYKNKKDVPGTIFSKNQNISTGLNKLTKEHLIQMIHEELNEKNIPHVFFNGNNDFDIIENPRFDIDCRRRDWGTSYIGPYDPKMTYDSLIRAQGIETVAPNSWHFGRDGHSYFSRFMLQYIIDNKFI